MSVCNNNSTFFVWSSEKDLNSIVPNGGDIAGDCGESKLIHISISKSSNDEVCICT